MDLLSALRSLPVPRLVGSALGLWVAYHLLYQAYRVFVYPYYVSPLRHLPGPTVCVIRARLGWRAVAG